MMRIRIRGVVFRLHPLAILMAGIAFAMGAREGLWAILVSLALHESAHLLAARLLRVRVEALDLLPFGGALQIENPYRLSRWQLFGVSLAGPVGSVLALLLSTAFAWWAVFSPKFALEMIRANIMLAAFNLLPVLPLDGGRALFALIGPRVGRKKALNALVGLGYALAAALVAAAAVGFARTGRLNLALMIAAVFLVAAGGRERREAAAGTAEALAERLTREGRQFARPERLRVLAVDEDTEALKVLRALNPREEALLAVYGSDGLSALIDSRAVERAMLEERTGEADHPMKMRNVLKNRRGLSDSTHFTA